MTKAKLVLEDSSVFEGNSFGSSCSSAGEVVFNTGMTGYPESLTDPSYRGQILMFTYPMIGNYGVPVPIEKNGLLSNFESSQIHVKGIIVADYSFDYSHWSARISLHEWLEKNNVPGIYGIDTIALTKKIREKGVMLGRIITDSEIPFDNPNVRNLVAEVSIRQPITYGNGQIKIIVVDCGAKNSIIHELLARNVLVKCVPYDYDFAEEDCEGILISNGPGDPKMCTQTIINIKKAVDRKVPIFGICLGNQLLALASGADTYKLKYGHRSQNQPCISNGRCYITSQNHGFAIDEQTLQPGWKSWFTNANDGSNEGIIHESGLFRSVQFHPEAVPGPVDTSFLFDEFVALCHKIIV